MDVSLDILGSWMVIGVATNGATIRVLVETDVVDLHLDGPHALERVKVNPSKVVRDSQVLRTTREGNGVSIVQRWTNERKQATNKEDVERLIWDMTVSDVSLGNGSEAPLSILPRELVVVEPCDVAVRAATVAMK
jgi:hypothetical protein